MLDIGDLGCIPLQIPNSEPNCRLRSEESAEISVAYTLLLTYPIFIKVGTLSKNAIVCLYFVFIIVIYVLPDFLVSTLAYVLADSSFALSFSTFVYDLSVSTLCLFWPRVLPEPLINPFFSTSCTWALTSSIPIPPFLTTECFHCQT